MHGTTDHQFKKYKIKKAMNKTWLWEFKQIIGYCPAAQA
ncbi:hypothetical protein AO382_1588 [Moraxella catarrhalis]|uniref:Uncharacterized protein n=1 Tax=Moraxella catarrhalis TaxID=480 RepID=A0A7Z1A3H1_MORCA|nr:hypothetical protein AO382_1588 [Moraxella catarrhalis]